MYLVVNDANTVIILCFISLNYVNRWWFNNRHLQNILVFIFMIKNSFLFSTIQYISLEYRSTHAIPLSIFVSLNTVYYEPYTCIELNQLEQDKQLVLIIVSPVHNFLMLFLIALKKFYYRNLISMKVKHIKRVIYE